MLRRRGSQPGTLCNNRRIGTFTFSYNFWWPAWKPQGHPTQSRAYRQQSGKAGRSQQRVRIVTKVSPRGVCWSKFSWQDKHWLSSFLSQESYCLLVSFLCPENLAWQPSGWTPTYDQIMVWIAPQLVAGSCWLLPSLGELSKSVFLWLSLGRIPGSAEGSSWPSLWGRLSCIQAVVQYYQPYLLLSQLKPDNIFEKICFFWQLCGHTGVENFFFPSLISLTNLIIKMDTGDRLTEEKQMSDIRKPYKNVRFSGNQVAEAI